MRQAASIGAVGAAQAVILISCDRIGIAMTAMKGEPQEQARSGDAPSVFMSGGMRVALVRSPARKGGAGGETLFDRLTHPPFAQNVWKIVSRTVIGHTHIRDITVASNLGWKDIEHHYSGIGSANASGVLRGRLDATKAFLDDDYGHHVRGR